MKNKKIKLRFKIGLLFGILHLLSFVNAWHIGATSQSGQAGMIFMTFVVIDFFLIPLFIFTPSLGIGIIIVFGFCGTLSWFFLPILIGNLIEFLKNRRARKREIIKS